MVKDDNTSKSTETLLIRKHIYNQLIKLMTDKEFTDFLEHQRRILGIYGTPEAKTFTPSAITNCRRVITKFLNKKKVPLSWREPTLSLIKDNELNLPLENTISIRVGGEELHVGSQEILIFKNKHSNIAADPTVSIVITADVSAEEIIRFIKENIKEIKFWQKELGLPKYKRLKWKEVDRALEIIQMKDKDKLTFSEIANNYSSREDLTENERNMLCDEAYLKKRYYRFKKHLQIK